MISSARTPSGAASGGSSVIPVSDFVRHIRRHVESGFPLGWVSGEVSNLVRAGSGHLYFTLKDNGGQMRCAMWRAKAQLLAFELVEGMQVEVRAQATVYEARGDLQLSVEYVRQAGQGNLFEAFMRLKARLENEGLFATERKRALPALPARIGLVTSSAGAALHDVIITLQRRAPGLELILYPTLVQGEGAGEQIAQSILIASARSRDDGIEALIVCRGGGSMEDLWAFNHEAVVRAIYGCPIPVLSGVGHETDTTLCDFVADVRAATPTAAAEIVSAGLHELRQRLPRLALELDRACMRRLEQLAQKIDLIERRLVHPQQRIAQHRAALDQLGLRMQHAVMRRHESMGRQLQGLHMRLERRVPDLQSRHAKLAALEGRLSASLRHNRIAAQSRLDALEASLTHLNPSAVLERGYAIVRDAAGKVVRQAAQVRDGDRLDVLLADGQIAAEVRDSQS